MPAPAIPTTAYAKHQPLNADRQPDPYAEPDAYQQYLIRTVTHPGTDPRATAIEQAYAAADAAFARERQAAASLARAGRGPVPLPNGVPYRHATEATDGNPPTDESWRMYLDAHEDMKDRNDVNAMAVNFADQIYRKEILDKDPFDGIPPNMEYAALEAEYGNEARDIHRSTSVPELAGRLMAYGYPPTRAFWASEALIDWRTVNPRTGRLHDWARATEAPDLNSPATPAGNDPMLPPNGNMPVDAALSPPPPDAIPIGGMPGGPAPDAFGDPAMDDPLAGIPDPLAEDATGGGGDMGMGDGEIVAALESILQILESHPEAPPEVMAVVDQLVQASTIDEISAILSEAAATASPEGQAILSEMLMAVPGGGGGDLGGGVPANSMIMPGDDEIAMLDDVGPALDMGAGPPPPDSPGAPPADTTPDPSLDQDEQIRRSLGEAASASYSPTVAEMQAWVSENACEGCVNTWARELNDTTSGRHGAPPYKTGPHPARNIQPHGTSGSSSGMTRVPRKAKKQRRSARAQGGGGTASQ